MSSDKKTQLEEDMSTEKTTPVTSTYQRLYSTEEYFVALDKWIHDAYIWQNITANFPYFLMCNQYVNQFSAINNNIPPNAIFPFTPQATNSINQQQNNLDANQANREG